MNHNEETVVSSHVQLNPSPNNQNTTSQQNEQHFITASIISDTQSSSSQMDLASNQTPCKYGMNCYRKNPVYFIHYSHPPEHPYASKIKQTTNDQTIEINFNYQEQNEYYSQEQTHYYLQQQNEYYQQEQNQKLREANMKMVVHHQQLKQAVVPELDNRERRKIEKQKILAIPRDTPSYWDINTFVQPYSQIDIHPKSLEFSVINDLLNGTIETHSNKYGTIYGQDPTEFIITKITQIRNNKLWCEYCCKKESIIQKNNNNLINCQSSKYLKQCPLLTPLLDATANEYWLFHGCDQKTISVLLHGGYDPRVSSLDGMFGGGFYLAENSSKSNQYISCPGCGMNAKGYDSRCSCKDQEEFEFSIILYRAVLGDIHVAKNYKKNIYRGDNKHRMRRPPLKENSVDLYDSVMGECTKYGGDTLKYREFILYEPGQAYPEYIIKFKRSAVNVRAPSDAKYILDKCCNFLRNRANLRHE